VEDRYAPTDLRINSNYDPNSLRKFQTVGSPTNVTIKKRAQTAGRRKTSITTRNEVNHKFVTHVPIYEPMY